MDPTDLPPPSPAIGPGGCAVMAAAFVVGIMLWAVGGGVAIVLGGIAVVGSVVLVCLRDPALRAIGAGTLAGFAVALLVIGVCSSTY